MPKFKSASNLLNFILLSSHIVQQKDPTGPALHFAKSIVCFIAELEKRKLFLENFHGSVIRFLPDMSVGFVFVQFIVINTIEIE